MGGHSARSAVRSDGDPSREPRDDVRWPPMAARRVVFRAFWGRQRRLTMPRIAGAALPARKTRKDDHTYHPIVIEGTKNALRRDAGAPQAARDAAGGRGGVPRIPEPGGHPRSPPTYGVWGIPPTYGTPCRPFHDMPQCIDSYTRILLRRHQITRSSVQCRHTLAPDIFEGCRSHRPRQSALKIPLPCADEVEHGWFSNIFCGIILFIPYSGDAAPVCLVDNAAMKFGPEYNRTPGVRRTFGEVTPKANNVKTGKDHGWHDREHQPHR